MKKYGLICILLVLCVLLQGCPSPIVWGNHPIQQPGTTWKTDDDRICFYIDDAHPQFAYGRIKTESETEEIVFNTSVHVTLVRIIKAENYVENSAEPYYEAFANGHGDTNGKNEYVIRITEADEIFEAGEVLVFHKVDQEQEKAD